MIVRTVEVGDNATNCYIVASQRTLEGLVIDPGEDVALILAEVKALKVRVLRIVITHGHFDHILGIKDLKEALNVPVAIHTADAGMLTNPLASFAFLAGKIRPLPPADELLQDGQVLAFGDDALTVSHTPGHSPGSVSLVGEGLVFCGDVLFQGSVGRTDFPGGSQSVLVRSIRTRLLTLPDSTVVYPGHGPATTIGHERLTNPYLRG